MPHTIKIKYDSIDVLKFILSFLIIQIHTEFYFIWMKPYVRLAVPIFFIISAFFFFRRNPGKEQLIGYIKRLSILYLFWFIVWGLYFVYANRAIVFSSQGFVFILRSLVFGSTFAASWYIAASIIGTIIVYVLSMGAGLAAVFMIFTALLFRTVGVLLCLVGTELNWKERLFCVIAYLPKATVQAAIGSVPMAMGLPCGQIVLSVAVMAILITAPLGALGMDSTFEKLLEKE